MSISTRIGIALWLAALGLGGARALLPAPVVKSEYEIKADFLRTCGRYVDWPPRAFPEADSPFVIGVLGKDPFGAALDNAVANRTVSSRRIVVRRFRRIEEMSACHLLFIGASENGRLAAIFERLGRASTLTVGETGTFFQRGGMVHLVIENQRLRWEVNQGMAERAGLKINSDMLRLAKSVRRGG